MMRILATALVLTSVALVSRPADACSPPLPGFESSMPPEGATVPNNVVWFVTGYEISPVTGYWLDWDVFLPLRTDNVGRIFQLHNDQFGPYPAFEALELFAEAGQPNIEPLRTTLRVVDRSDFEPPQLQEELSLAFELLEDEPGLCQQGGFHVAVTHSAAIDEHGIGAYHLYEVSGAGRMLRGSRLGHAGVIRALINQRAYEGYEPGRRCYVIDAVDFAGNVARGKTPTCIDLTTGGIVDAGVIDSGSSGPPDAGPGAVRDAGNTNNKNPPGLDLSAGRGCGCHADPRGDTSPFTALVALGLFVLVRRRRSVQQRA